MNELDNQLLARVKHALSAVDPVPGDAVAAAKAVFVARHLDAELAELVRDSTRDAGVLAMRGAAPRALSFEADDTSIELEVDLDRNRIRGQIAPAVPASLTLEIDGKPVEATATDDFGRFVFSDVSGDTTTASIRVRIGEQDLICTFDL